MFDRVLNMPLFDLMDCIAACLFFKKISYTNLDRKMDNVNEYNLTNFILYLIDVLLLYYYL